MMRHGWPPRRGGKMKSPSDVPTIPPGYLSADVYMRELFREYVPSHTLSRLDALVLNAFAQPRGARQSLETIVVWLAGDEAWRQLPALTHAYSRIARDALERLQAHGILLRQADGRYRLNDMPEEEPACTAPPPA